MNEKMTDEELEQALESMLKGFMQARRKVRAHIAALTAERDALKAEMADECKAHMRLQEDARAIRERVQALEAERDTARDAGIRQHKARLEAESRLAAIRTTARTLQSMSLSTVMGGEWNRQASALIREMAGDDARPSAPPEAFAHEKGVDAGVFDDDDRSPTPPAVVAAAGGVGLPQLPTTPEAFATVRERFAALRGASHVMHELGVESDGSVESGVAKAEAALTLLERRMGAMDAAIRAFISEHPCTPDGCQYCKGLHATLTDAPAVLTLEQAKALEARLGGEVPNPGEQYLSGWLDALNTFVQELERLTALRK